MDIEFNCPQCNQSLSVEDESAAGSEIECPECGSTIVIPVTAPRRSAAIAPPPVPAGGGSVVNATAASAGAKEEKHFVVPQHDKKAESLITKPLVSLETAAKTGGDKQMRVRTIKHSECVEVGKDHFDEEIAKFIARVGDANVISISPFNYSHQDLASREWITDYGVMVVYRG